MHTAILFCVDISSRETFTFSRSTSYSRKNDVYYFLTKEANITNPDIVDTILLLENGIGTEAPKVIGFWRAANGDF